MTGFDEANLKAIFASGVGSVLSGDVLMEDGATVTEGKAAAAFGINDIISDADIDLVDTTSDLDFGGIDRTDAGQDHWKGSVTAMGGAISFQTMDAAVSKGVTRSGRIVDRLYMTNTVRRLYQEQYNDAYPGIAPPYLTIKPGHEILAWQHGEKKIGIRISDKIPTTEIWGLSFPTIKIRHVRDIHWRDETGKQLLYPVLDEYACFAYLIYEYNVTCNNPMANIKVTGITA